MGGNLFLGFAILFFLAMIARLVSRYYLIKQYEPKFKEDEKYYFSFSQFVKKFGEEGEDQIISEDSPFTLRW